MERIFKNILIKVKTLFCAYETALKVMDNIL